MMISSRVFFQNGRTIMIFSSIDMTTKILLPKRKRLSHDFNFYQNQLSIPVSLLRSVSLLKLKHESANISEAIDLAS